MAKVDYDALEREYITSSISIRKLAEKHGMKSWSAVADQARKQDSAGKTWTDKRDEFRRGVTEKRMEKDVKSFVSKADELDFEMIQAARAIIFKGLELIRDGVVIPQPRDMLMAIDKLQLLTGRATERTEATVYGNSTVLGATIDTDFLHRIEELTRGAEDLRPGPSRLRIEGSKPN
jgi:hypothetical protein